jgi:hypothetical protein
MSIYLNLFSKIKTEKYNKTLRKSEKNRRYRKVGIRK